MMNDPSVLLLDEPFRAMDALTKTVVHQFLLDVYDKSKKTVFFITHDLEEAIFLGSKVYIMTTRPAKIKTILDVDIPRPRDFRVLSPRPTSGSRRSASRRSTRRPSRPSRPASGKWPRARTIQGQQLRR